MPASAAIRLGSDLVGGSGLPARTAAQRGRKSERATIHAPTFAMRSAKRDKLVAARLTIPAPFIKGRRLGGLARRHVPRPSLRPRIRAGRRIGKRHGRGRDRRGSEASTRCTARIRSNERLERLQQAEAKRTGKARSRARAIRIAAAVLFGHLIGAPVGGGRDRLGAGQPGSGTGLPVVHAADAVPRVRRRAAERDANFQDRNSAGQFEEVARQRGGRRQDRPDAPVHDRADRSAAPRAVRHQLHQQRAVDADRARR